LIDHEFSVKCKLTTFLFLFSNGHRSYSMNSYDSNYYNCNVMNFDLIANDYVDSTTYDQKLMLSVDAQFGSLTNTSNSITNGS
jgi:hypothetical protein